LPSFAFSNNSNNNNNNNSNKEQHSSELFVGLRKFSLS
jgi:hypothetical protein